MPFESHEVTQRGSVILSSPNMTNFPAKNSVGEGEVPYETDVTAQVSLGMRTIFGKYIKI
jgi:hypothetical protein